MEQMRKNRAGSNELQRAKFDLCSVYLLNLHVYMALDEEERDDHPVRSALERIEQIFRRTVQEGSSGAAPAEERSGRTKTRDVHESGCREKRQKKDDANPLLKNRKRAQKLFEKGKQTFDGSIDARKSRSAKY